MQEISSPFISKLTIPPSHKGRLTGLTFAVKDVFAVVNHTASLGNPEWQRSHQPAEKNAKVINRLLSAGATLTGITVSDELMFSIKGHNVHFGDPLNAAHPDCYTGGSSSGSASAVAMHVVDFALGTDTGGSIRTPASYCDLYGFRPTVNPTLMTGIAPLSQQFDTIGLLAPTSQRLNQVGQVLYRELSPLDVRRAYTLTDEPVDSSILQRLSNDLGLSASQIHDLKLPVSFKLPQLLRAFKTIQGFEAWQNYGAWLSQHDANLGKDIAEHFGFASQVSVDDYQSAIEIKKAWHDYLSSILQNQAVLILPTTSTTAIKKDIDFNVGEKIRYETQLLTTIAGLAGVPQVALPVHIANNDRGVSIISNAHTDSALLKLASAINLCQN